MVAAIPPGPASVFSLVFCPGSKYGLLKYALTVSSVSISWIRLNDLWYPDKHWNLAFSFSSSLSGAVACANPSLKSAFALAKNRMDRTSAADCGGPATFRAATLSGSGNVKVKTFI